MSADEELFDLPDGDTLTLTFEGTRYDGLRVVCRQGASIDFALYLQGFMSSVSAGDKQAVSARFVETMRRFGDEVLVSWNLRDKKTKLPLPASGAGMHALPDQPLAMEIMRRWMAEVISVAAPLGTASSNGASSAPELTTATESS